MTIKPLNLWTSASVTGVCFKSRLSTVCVFMFGGSGSAARHRADCVGALCWQTLHCNVSEKKFSMVFRKLPGVSASGMGLRLSQKFVFLLFLSGLVTLCFGALFFLPDSVRLKRIFLSKTETQPVTVGSGSENDAREHLKRAGKEPEPPRGVTSAKGETSTKLKSLIRKAFVSHEATEERLAGDRAQEELTLSRSRTESASERVTSSDRAAAGSDTFSYQKFTRCLLKPPLGRDGGKPSDPKTEERRVKVKEVRMSLHNTIMTESFCREGMGDSFTGCVESACICARWWISHGSHWSTHLRDKGEMVTLQGDHGSFRYFCRRGTGDSVVWNYKGIRDWKRGAIFNSGGESRTAITCARWWISNPSQSDNERGKDELVTRGRSMTVS